MSNATEWPLTAHLPDDTDATHREGVANPAWPLCLEAEAVRRGFSTEDIANGETAAEYEMSENGFWVVTCAACLAQVHA